jgi:uncharacterized protein YbcI
MSATSNSANITDPYREAEPQLAASAEEPRSAASGEVGLIAVANRVARLYKQTFGRGPTSTRAFWAGPDALVILLDGALTVAEHRLLELGEEDGLRDARLILQRSLEQPTRLAVEDALGRRAVAFVTGADLERDVAVSVITVQPAGRSRHATVSARDEAAAAGRPHAAGWQVGLRTAR